VASSSQVAMAERRQWGKTIPKEEPKKKAPEYYIGEQGVNRKRVSGKFDLEERWRRGMPNPAPGNNARRSQKRKGPPAPENPQPNRKPPPKPDGRLNRPSRKR